MAKLLVQRFVSANYVISLIFWLLILTAVVVLGSLYYFLNTLNTFADGELQHRVSLALEIEEKHKRQLLTEYSYWDEAYENTIVSPDESWIENNSGDYLLQNYDFDFSLSVNNYNTNTFLTKSEDAEGLTFEKMMNHGLAQMMNLSDKADIESKVVSQFMLLSNHIYLLTGGPFLDEVKEIPRPGTYFVLGKKIDQEYIEELAFSYHIPGLKLTPGSGSPESSMDLFSPAGTKIATLSWSPNKAGEEVVPFIATLIISFFLATIIVTRLILHKELANRTAYEEKLYLEATRDSLTKINNRRYFMELGKKEFLLFRNQERHFTIIAIDIDHFKKINDTYGHKAGDKALIHFTKLCNQYLRESDIFGRIGGEEFAVILPNTDIEEALSVANRIREMVMEAALHVDENIINMTCSIGVAALTEQPHFDTLLEQADKALYKAKSSGRNQVIIYS